MKEFSILGTSYPKRVYTLSKMETVKKWPVPQNKKDVQKFLLFTEYYRRFIKGYAALARPLTDLLVGHLTKPKGKRKKVVAKHL